MTKSCPKENTDFFHFLLLKVLNLFYDVFAGLMFACQGKTRSSFPSFPIFVIFNARIELENIQ